MYYVVDRVPATGTIVWQTRVTATGTRLPGVSAVTAGDRIVEDGHVLFVVDVLLEIR